MKSLQINKNKRYQGAHLALINADLFDINHTLIQMTN